jgi:hypothetical protein
MANTTSPKYMIARMLALSGSFGGAIIISTVSARLS